MFNRTTARFLPLVAAALLLSPLPALAQQGPGRGGSWCPFFSGGGSWMGGFPMILVWILLIVVVIVGIRWALGSRGGSGAVDKEGALEVLKRRYAAGEISREQFQEMKKELGY